MPHGVDGGTQGRQQSRQGHRGAQCLATPFPALLSSSCPRPDGQGAARQPWEAGLLFHPHPVTALGS